MAGDEHYDDPPTDDILSLTRPWATDAQSIYEFLRAVVGRKGQYWDEPDGLPDDTRLGRRGGRWERPTDLKATADQLVAALRELVQEPSAAGLARLHETLRTNVLWLVDVLPESLKDGLLDEPARVRAVGRMLATEAPQPGPVAFGIAILGTFGSTDDVEVLAALGVCHVFAHAVLPALKQLLPDPEDVFVEIARQSNSWAKVDFVTDLCQTNRADIKRWLLLEGFENSLVACETADLCAEAGGLAAMLDTPLNTAELDAVSRLIHTLIVDPHPPTRGFVRLDATTILGRYIEQAVRADPTFDIVVGLAAARREIDVGRVVQPPDASLLMAVCDEYFAREDVRARLEEWRASPVGWVAWRAKKATTNAGLG